MATGCGLIILTELTAIQPLLSLAVTEYTAPLRFEIALDVSPFDHRYVYGGVPPFTTKSAVALLALKHVILVDMIVSVR